MEVPFIGKQKAWKTKAVRQVPSFDFSSDLWRCCWPWNRPRILCQPQVMEVRMGTEQHPCIFHRSDSSAHNLHPPGFSQEMPPSPRNRMETKPQEPCVLSAGDQLVQDLKAGRLAQGEERKEKASLTRTHVFLSSSQPDSHPLLTERDRQAHMHT